MKLFLTFILVLVTLTNCKSQKEQKHEDEFEKQMAEFTKTEGPAKEILEKRRKELEAGGQPGYISLQGVIINEELKLDSRIEVTSIGGLSIEGKEAIIQESHRPFLNQKFELKEKGDEKLEQLKEEKSLLIFGCDQDFTNQLTKNFSLQALTKPKPSENGVYLFEANTIAICGEANDLHIDMAVFKADKLIFKNVQMDYSAFFSFHQFLANDLQLIGSSVLSYKLNNSDGFQSISLIVTKSVNSDEQGHLQIISKGGDYTPPKK
jgi:hypothetical protein